MIIWIISQNSGTSNLGGVQRHYFFAKEFKKNDLDTTIISCQKNHLYTHKPKKGICEIEGVKFLQLYTFFSFSKGILRFFQMFEFYECTSFRYFHTLYCITLPGLLVGANNGK